MNPSRRVRFEVCGAVYEDANFHIVSLKLEQAVPTIIFGRSFQGRATEFFKDANGSTSKEVVVFHDEQGLRPWIRWTGGKLGYSIQIWPYYDWADIQELVQILGGNVEVFDE